MTLKLASTYPARLVVDVDETGTETAIEIRVKRLNEEEYAVFAADLATLNDPPSNTFTDVRHDDEQAEAEGGGFVIPITEIRRRRLAAMDRETRARYDAADAADEAFAKAFLVRAISDFVSVPVDVLAIDDVPVLTGRDLLRVFGAQVDLLRELMMTVWLENTLSTAQKKAWRSWSDSRRTSTGRPPAPTGPRPAPTADAAAHGDSVEIVAAIGRSLRPRTESPSGSPTAG